MGQFLRFKKAYKFNHTQAVLDNLDKVETASQAGNCYLAMVVEVYTTPALRHAIEYTHTEREEAAVCGPQLHVVRNSIG